MKHLYLLLFFILSMQLYAQEERVSIMGEIKNDSVPIEDVHIVNLSARIGTISNQYGLFQISVKANDTLILTDIQYQIKKIIISENDIKQRIIEIKLQTNINELDEVIVEKPKNIFFVEIDENLSKVDENTLELPNAGKTPLTQTERKLNYYQKGGNLDKIYGLISGDTKKFKKLLKNEKEDEILNSIRTYVSDDFLIENLLIPEDDILKYLDYCKTKGIVEYFKRDNKMKVVDILVESRKEYLELSK